MNRKILDGMAHYDKNLSFKLINGKVDNNVLLEIQDKQLEDFQRIQKSIDEGKIEEGIKELEDIIYNKGGMMIISNHWSMYLANVLYKNKMYDRCWKYLLYIKDVNLNILDKVYKMQSQILFAEQKYKDALFYIVLYHCFDYLPTYVDEEIEMIKITKSISKYVKKVELNVSLDVFLKKVRYYILNREIEEREIRDGLVEMFK